MKSASRQIQGHGRRRPTALDARVHPIAVAVRTALLPATIALATPAVLASLQGGQVVGGSGDIGRPNARTTIVDRHSPSLAIDWQSYNLAREDLVRYHQPSASAAVLNRIVGQHPSEILGQIQANGRVFLINPNGILFGPSAQVNVGSLVASGLDLDPQDFMAGRYDLRAPAGATGGVVVNRGLLQAATGSSVTLVGGAVRNTELIVASYGQVNLGAGQQATLGFDGDGLIRFAVEGAVLENARGLGSAVSNAGEIRADGGEVVLTARTAQDVFSRVVNNEGLIQARRIENAGDLTLAANGTAGPGDVTIEAGTDVTWTTPHDLTVRADGRVALLGTIDAMAGSTVIEATDVVVQVPDAGTGSGDNSTPGTGDAVLIGGGSEVVFVTVGIGPIIGTTANNLIDGSLTFSAGAIASNQLITAEITLEPITSTEIQAVTSSAITIDPDPRLWGKTFSWLRSPLKPFWHMSTATSALASRANGPDTDALNASARSNHSFWLSHRLLSSLASRWTA